MTTSELETRLAARTLELCAIDSVIGNESAIADHVEQWAHSIFGADVFRLSNSLVCGKASPSSLALFGHLDTVPPAANTQPPKRIGDRLHGLGTSDMKSGLAVMMALAESRNGEGLLLAFYDREEGPFEQSGLGPLLDARSDLLRAPLGICLEPSDGAVQVGACGSLHATLRFSGKRAHSARPWQGANAIHGAGPLLAELAALPRREVKFDGLIFFEVFTVTLATAPGAARNVVPDRFELNLNYRFAPGTSVDAAKANVLALVAGRAEVHFTDTAPSGKACLGNPIVRQLIAASGRAPEPKQAWTDVARLTARGLDAVNFGPGETAQAHQAGESCAVSGLVHCYVALTTLFT